LVNVIAPIMTNENGLFRQTIYYPYSWALQYARGKALDLVPVSPAYEISSFQRRAFGGGGKTPVPYLDVSGTIDSESKTATLFILNRDLEKPRDLQVVWHEATPTRVNTCMVLTGSDLKAVNGFDAPNRVVPGALEAPPVGSRMTFQLPAHSYTVVNVTLT